MVIIKRVLLHPGRQNINRPAFFRGRFLQNLGQGGDDRILGGKMAGIDDAKIAGFSPAGGAELDLGLGNTCRRLHSDGDWY